MFKEGQKVVYVGPAQKSYLQAGDVLTIVWLPEGHDWANTVNAKGQSISQVQLSNLKNLGQSATNRQKKRGWPKKERYSTRYGDDTMSNQASQKRFYRHLCMHPNAHADATKMAKLICAKDANAITFLKTLAAGAATDPRKANALRAIAVCVQEECGGVDANPMVAGLSVSGILKTALSPAAWALHTGASAFHWVGTVLQKFSHAI